VRPVFGLSEIDREIDRCKVLTPEIDREIDRGKVLTLKIDCEIDRDKVLGTEVRFLEKSRNTDQKGHKKEKNQEIYSKNGTVGQVFDFQK
jgi:hypothetical protein